MKTFVLILSLCLLAGRPLLAQEADNPAPADDAPQETVITSNELELVGGDAENRFYFTDNVKITGTNLLATCDYMEVIAARSGPTEKTVGQMGAIQKILMKGNVVIEQAGRVATAGQAEILPHEDVVILTENPMVKDSQGTVTGYKMELLKGERKAKVYGDPNAPDGGRTKVTLPGFKDLGFEDKEEQPKQQPETPEWKTPNQ